MFFHRFPDHLVEFVLNFIGTVICLRMAYPFQSDMAENLVEMLMRVGNAHESWLKEV